MASCWALVVLVACGTGQHDVSADMHGVDTFSDLGDVRCTPHVRCRNSPTGGTS